MKKLKLILVGLLSFSICGAYASKTTLLQVDLNADTLEQDTIVSFIFDSGEEIGPGATSFESKYNSRSPFGEYILGDQKVSITQATVKYGMSEWTKYVMDSSCKNIDMSQSGGGRRIVWIQMTLDISNYKISCIRQF